MKLGTNPPTPKQVEMVEAVRTGFPSSRMRERFNMAYQSVQASVTRLAAARWVSLDLRVYTPEEREQVLAFERDLAK